jgi:hypothetical protein
MVERFAVADRASKEGILREERGHCIQIQRMRTVRDHRLRQAAVHQ